MAAGIPGLAIERDGHVLTIWLDRPEQRNALTLAMRTGIVESIEAGDADPTIRAIVVRGRGGTFCAGADLQRVEGDMGRGDTTDRIHSGAAILHRIASTTTPTVAVIEGFAIAGGFELMLACDLAIATHDARIGDFHINRGLVAGAGPLYRLPRLVGLRRAKELMLTGMLLSGEQAGEWGLINRVVSPGDEVDTVLSALVGSLTDKSPYVVAATNRALARSLETDSETMRSVERATVDDVFGSADAQEGVRAFLERRPPVWTGQ